jgi:hypothetical protein
MLNQKRCRFHGGRSPQALAAATRRMAESRATAAIDREGLRPVNDPISALRELAAEAMSVKDFFAARVAALEQLRYEGHAGEQVRAELTAYERALDRAGRFCVDLAKLNLDARMVAVSEAQGRMLAERVEAALLACGLSDRLDLRHGTPIGCESWSPGDVGGSRRPDRTLGSIPARSGRAGSGSATARG